MYLTRFPYAATAMSCSASVAGKCNAIHHPGGVSMCYKMLVRKNGFMNDNRDDGLTVKLRCVVKFRSA